MSLLDIDFTTTKQIAVAVSGGGDSMALAILLSEWVKEQGIKLHAITVDHDLRPESLTEAKTVAKILKPLGITHKILKWEGTKPKTKIQEAARDARYQLMSDYCLQKKIPYLCVAHHGQDQMETILFRMAKGTGLDGMAGMRPVNILDNSLTLLRPLLPISHKDLLETLKSKKIDWIEDPSNVNDRYARVRIRNTIDTLENEGLTPERISSLSNRVINSIDLIDHLIEKEYKSITIYKDTQRIEINYTSLLSLPIEGKTRILKMLISEFQPHKKYAARLEDIERLAHKMGENFKGGTLGGCLFCKKKTVLTISHEHELA
jgi:tRNA(Ile)-lysidine synthase